MIDSFGHPKIGDFGTSRLLSVDATLTVGVGTPRYMAPECWNEGDYTNTIDVYSFGLILYETLVGNPVFSPNTPLFLLMKKASTGIRVRIPDTMNPAVREIIESAWAPVPDARPSFSDILCRLELLDFRLTPKVDSERVRAYIETIPANFGTDDGSDAQSSHSTP
jgi:serine/threonine protein kinase